MKKYLILYVVMLFVGCSTDADVATHNMKKKAEMFEINRRIVFYNGITGEYMLVIYGRSSVETVNDRLVVTCKTGENEYKMHYLGLSDNVTYFSEQIDDAEVGVYMYDVIFKPESIIPNLKTITK